MVQKIKKQKLLFSIGTFLVAAAFIMAYSGFGGKNTAPTSVKSPPDSAASLSQPDPSLSQTTDSNSEDSLSTAGTAGASETSQPAIVNREKTTFRSESGEEFPLRAYKPLAVNDPGGNQWWTSGTGLDTAWNTGSGARQTTVAVIDTGFALAHEEFTGRWAVNSGEQGAVASEAASKLNCTDRALPLTQECNLIDDDYDGTVDNETGAASRQNPSRLNCTSKGLALNKTCNMIDDDGNGYIDDLTGWDFANFDATVQAGETNPAGDGTQHGTAVASVLAASGNNAKGIAGVDWNTKILPLQALDDDSIGNTLTVGRAVYYAVNRGVDVINLSLGSTEEDAYLRQAIHYALDRNVIVVAASGNDGCDCISYPARYPEVIAVGAQNQSGAASSFSSYGASLDLLAPGENMTTASWSPSLPTNGYASGMAGTSFAAPYVSGLLSLARSHQPTAQWGEIANALLSTANHGTLTTNNPFSDRSGSGTTKAGDFLTRLLTPSQPMIRYGFRPTPIKSTLSSTLSYQCLGAPDFPTAPLYEVTSGASTFYTIDELERLRAVNRGNTVTYIARVCVGLPNDIPTSVRLINLLSEIKNLPNGKIW